MNDHDLIREFATGRSEPAFRQLVERHCDLVYSVARRVTRDPDLARDVSQQVFCKLAAKPGSVPASLPLVAWLHRTTRSLAVDLVRSEQSRRQREGKVPTLESMHAEPTPDWSRLEPVIDALIDQLPEADRRAVILRFYEKRSHGAIGAALGLSEDAARKRLDRALEKLRGLLAKRGIATTSAALAAILPAHATTPAPAGLAASLSSTALSTTVVTSSIIAAIMSHKAALTGTALLLLAGVTAVAVPKLTQDKSAVVNTPASPSSDVVRETGTASAAGSRTRSRGGEVNERLTAKFGDSRTKLSAHLCGELIGMMEDSLSVMDMAHKMDLEAAMAGDAEEILGDAGKGLALTEEQAGKIAGLQMESIRRETEDTRALIVTMRKDPSKMMEYLLMQDAVKRGAMDRAEFDHLKGALDLPEGSTEFSLESSGSDDPMEDESFVQAVMEILDEEQARLLQENLASRADMQEPGPEAELSSLEEVEKTLSSGRKMIQGAMQMIEGMTNGAIAPAGN